MFTNKSEKGTKEQTLSLVKAYGDTYHKKGI